MTTRNNTPPPHSPRTAVLQAICATCGDGITPTTARHPQPDTCGATTDGDPAPCVLTPGHHSPWHLDVYGSTWRSHPAT